MFRTAHSFSYSGIDHAKNCFYVKIPIDVASVIPASSVSLQWKRSLLKAFGSPSHGVFRTRCGFSVQLVLVSSRKHLSSGRTLLKLLFSSFNCTLKCLICIDLTVCAKVYF